jgi:hypothetical protein
MMRKTHTYNALHGPGVAVGEFLQVVHLWERSKNEPTVTMTVTVTVTVTVRPQAERSKSQLPTALGDWKRDYRDRCRDWVYQLLYFAFGHSHAWSRHICFSDKIKVHNTIQCTAFSHLEAQPSRVSFLSIILQSQRGLNRKPADPYPRARGS